MILVRHIISVLAILGTTCAGAMAADAPTYWQDVRPILRKHCTVCHSERKQADRDISAGLALDRLPNIQKGGPGGVVLVAGRPEESPLVTLLTSKDKRRAMPQDAEPLADAEIALLRKWVAAGAPEGQPPKDDGGVAPGNANSVRLVRKLDVTLGTRASLPKAAGRPGTLELVLPIGPLPPMAAVAFSPDGRVLATGRYGLVTLWDLAKAKPLRTITNVLGAVHDLKFSPDGKLLAVAGGQPSARGDLRLFDLATGKLVHSLGGHLDTVSAVAFSPSGNQIASASFDKTVRLWDAISGKLLHTFTGHSDFVYAIAFAPSGEWYATVSKDRTGRIVSAKTGASELTLSGMEQEILAIAVTPDGKLVVTSGFETQLYWWDAKTGERQKRIGGPAIAVHELAIDPTGKVCAAAGGDGSLRFYKPGGDLIKAVPTGNPVFAVALDSTGSRTASGGADGTVKIWDTVNVRLLATLWSGSTDDWLAVTPEGYCTGTPTLLAPQVWHVGGKAISDAKWLAPLNDPNAVGKAMLGEKVPAPSWK